MICSSEILELADCCLDLLLDDIAICLSINVYYLKNIIAKSKVQIQYKYGREVLALFQVDIGLDSGRFFTEKLDRCFCYDVYVHIVTRRSMKMDKQSFLLWLDDFYPINGEKWWRGFWGNGPAINQV